MIRRDSSSNTQQTGSVVPASWMLIYLIFKGIAEDKIQKAAKLWVESQENTWPRKEVSFFKAFHSLFEELCVRVSHLFLWPDISQQDKEESIGDMHFVASEIVRIFEANQSKILQFGDHQPDNYPNEVYAIYSNCRIIEKVLVWKDEYELDKPENNFEFFSDTFLRSLYENLVSCFYFDEGKKESLSYQEFHAVLNLDEEIDLSQVKFSPIENNGMLLYALIAFLSLKRNEECSKNPVLLYKNSDKGPIEVDPLDGNAKCDFYLADKQYWTSEFFKRIAWTGEYQIEEDLWKTAYYDSDQKAVILRTKEVSEKDSSALARIVHRKVFEEICSPENIGAVVSSDFNGLSANDYLYLWKEYGPDVPNSENRIKELYHLLCRETKYFYNNIDQLSIVFKGEEDAEHLCWLSRLHESLKEESDRVIDQMFWNTDDFDMDLAYSCLMERCDFWDIALCRQRRVTTSTMRTYILNCISQDEKLKQFLLQKMEELSFMASIKTTDVKECWQISILEELRKEGLIDSNNVIKSGKKHALLRYLVEKEYLKPKDGWRAALKKEVGKVLGSSRLPIERGDGRKRIKQDVFTNDFKFRHDYFSRFTALIQWDSFGGVFYQAGRDTPLSGSDLRDDFNSNPLLGTNKKGEDNEIEIIRKLISNNMDTE